MKGVGTPLLLAFFSYLFHFSHMRAFTFVPTASPTFPPFMCKARASRAQQASRASRSSAAVVEGERREGEGSGGSHEAR